MSKTHPHNTPGTNHSLRSPRSRIFFNTRKISPPPAHTASTLIVHRSLYLLIVHRSLYLQNDYNFIPDILSGFMSGFSTHLTYLTSTLTRKSPSPVHRSLSLVPCPLSLVHRPLSLSYHPINLHWTITSVPSPSFIVSQEPPKDLTPPHQSSPIPNPKNSVPGSRSPRSLSPAPRSSLPRITSKLYQSV